MASVTSVGKAGVPLGRVSDPTITILYATLKTKSIYLPADRADFSAIAMECQIPFVRFMNFLGIVATYTHGSMEK